MELASNLSEIVLKADLKAKTLFSFLDGVGGNSSVICVQLGRCLFTPLLSQTQQDMRGNFTNVGEIPSYSYLSKPPPLEDLPPISVSLTILKFPLLSVLEAIVTRTNIVNLLGGDTDSSKNLGK